MSRAVCDQEAFYPLRSLVAGPFTDLRELTRIECFIRTVVLHDEISMELEPRPYDADTERERLAQEQSPGRRTVIVAMGPLLTGYDFFTERQSGRKVETPDITLSSSLLEIAQTFSNAEEGNVYYETHIEYLQRIVSVLQKGGSALLAGGFGNAAIKSSSKYPLKLFENLDRDWQQFARKADAGEFGFMVPPVLSIVLTRCAKREAIPVIIKDLRDEWADARSKIWTLLDRLKNVRTVAESHEIQQEMAEASRLLSPAQEPFKTRPVRVLWDLVAASVAGAAAAELSGGHAEVGAAVGALGKASQIIAPVVKELGPILFGRGAFDLAKRVRKEAMRVEYDALTRLITNVEKQKLGL